MTNNQTLKFLKQKDVEPLLWAGSIILGVPKEDLGSQFITNIDILLFDISNSATHLVNDLRLQFYSLNSRLLSLVLVRRVSKFINMNDKTKQRYLEAWMNSPLSILRKGFVSFRGLCGWGYYGQENVQKHDMQFSGMPLGREHETPTLLSGKKPWSFLNSDNDP